MNKKNLRIYEKVNKVMNYFVLGWLWLLTCIPVVTIGAASTATYKVFRMCMEDEEGYVFGQFFSCFKKDFKASTKAWAVLFVAGAIVACGSYSVFMQNFFEEYKHLFISLYVLEGVFILFLFIYLFPYIATFEDKASVSIKNAFIISISNIHYSILMVVTDAAIVVAGLFMYVVLLFAPAIVWYINTKIIRKILLAYRN